ncbi:hypothetical protein MUK42_24156 [Musa troglodytarum]|uniref:Uncharacterized protein n=1 Tax=Musa troglodytarum TaxID=320322 RepID=A0A9E7HG93_9LILI|nr:hypothetical protein MUK42_24156 [Musa troglodytarum]
MRSAAYPDLGANRLLLLPEVANMTVLTVERHPWRATTSSASRTLLLPPAHRGGGGGVAGRAPSVQAEAPVGVRRRPAIGRGQGLCSVHHHEPVLEIEPVHPGRLRSGSARVWRPRPSARRDARGRVLPAAARRVVHPAVHLRRGPRGVHPSVLLRARGLHTVRVVFTRPTRGLVGSVRTGPMGPGRGRIGPDPESRGGEDEGDGARANTEVDLRPPGREPK